MILPVAMLTAALAAPASAQVFGNGRWTATTSQAGYDRGYQEGIKEGAKDARNRDFELEREKKYQKADEGYNKSYGDKETYRRSFRQGFATGYTDAYNGRNTNAYGYPGTRPRAVPRGSTYPGSTYPNQYPSQTYPGFPRYPNGTSGSRYDLARQNGYYDGIEKGREDLRKNRDADPLRHDWYRSADRGYESDRTISKESYRDAYREGFRTGYDQGYRQTEWRPMR
jgi:hypothetical protein